MSAASGLTRRTCSPETFISIRERIAHRALSRPGHRGVSSPVGRPRIAAGSLLMHSQYTPLPGYFNGECGGFQAASPSGTAASTPQGN